MDITRQYVRQFLSEEVSDKQKYYLDKIRSKELDYSRVPKEYRTPEFHMELLKIDPRYFPAIKPSLQTQEMVDFVIKKNPHLLYAVAMSKRTKELCDYVVDNAEDYDKNPDLTKDYSKDPGLSLGSIPGKHKTPELLKKLIDKLPKRYAGIVLRGVTAKNLTPEIIDMYVQKFGYSSLIRECESSKDLFGSAITPDLIKKAIKEDPKVLDCIPDEYKPQIKRNLDSIEIHS